MFSLKILYPAGFEPWSSVTEADAMSPLCQVELEIVDLNKKLIGRKDVTLGAVDDDVIIQG
jgi:hypothetical protein